ncbi:MAG: ATP-dependent DNA helicase RecG [Vicinamibacteria bacterium]|nr:ATP-dependent DNA helicase RecG [Vicinamibacteria bacterium]
MPSPTALSLDSPVRQIRGVGPSRASALENAGITTVEDLLYHIPFRYEDRRQFTKIRDLEIGRRAVIRGRIARILLHRRFRRTFLEAWIEDESGRIRALWFNQPYLASRLVVNAGVVLCGTVAIDRRLGIKTLMSPQLELPSDHGSARITGIVAVYERLGGLSSRVLRGVIMRLLDDLSSRMDDPLSADVVRRLEVTGREEAFRIIHLPDGDQDVEKLNVRRSPGHVRLILEELFLFQLGLASRRRLARLGFQDARFMIDERVRAAVRRILPFRLTEAQQRVAREIADDMRAPHPMRRLIQGDVGAGKTVIALLACVIAVENGRQAAFMAPTEILAEQHFSTFRRYLADAYSARLLTSRLRGRERERAVRDVAEGSARIVIGTHALIQEAVRFKRLGLVVVDEQHRFGVLARDELIRKGWRADLLVMTATPIPRTLALTAFGDLDVSVIDALPPGRGAIRTMHLSSAEPRRINALLEETLDAGRQAYVVYPLVEESATLDEVRSVMRMTAVWRAALPHRRVGILHGRMSSAEKERAMTAFSRGAIDVLVTTSIIEVGIDVPNATLIVIEHAERFGLAQLHQLRGRVGRGGHPSTCLLVSHGPLSAEARARVETLTATHDGFVVAERDLELRGPGDLVGTRQWGAPRMRIADLQRDFDLLAHARSHAFDYAEAIDADPGARSLREFISGPGWERRFGMSLRV